MPKALNVNPVVVQQPFNISSSGGFVTFSFIGRFSDYNNKQTFQVNYTNSSGASSWDATFPKIKSLLTANSFSQIFPTPSSITAQRCQIQNFNISFSNVQYGNPWETPPIGYGTVTNYEYLLPAGWIMNSTTSTGSNWIAGSNNVTVTSDLSNGLNGVIRIRPVNTACGSGLQPGQEATVAISRPAPTLTITGPQSTICNVGQTASFTMNGMPAGSTIAWTISNPAVASIVGCSTCVNVTVSKTANVNEIVYLNATVNHCSFSYPVGPKQIALGTGNNNINFTQLDVVCESPRRPYFYGAIQHFAGATHYDWYSKDMNDPNNPFIHQQYGGSTADFPLIYEDRYYTIKVIATTPCGTVSSNEGEGLILTPTCIGENYRLTLSPNPSASIVNISLEPEKEKRDKKKNEIQLIEVRNKDGILVITKKYGGGITKATLDISSLRPDIYYLRIWNGIEWLSKKLIKQ